MTATQDQTAEVAGERPEHRFTFGLWTVGNPGRDPFGGPTREPRRPRRLGAQARRARRLGRQPARRRPDPVGRLGAPSATGSSRASRTALEATGMGVGMATTNLFGHAAFKDGAFTSNDRGVRRAAIGKAMRFIDIAAELGAEVYVFWGGREGTEAGVAKDPRDALERYREAINVLSDYVVDQGYDLRFAMEPKPNEPRGDIFLPTVGHALHFIETLDRPGDGRRQPRGRARDDGRAVVPPRDRPGAVGGQALPHRPQRPADRPLRPGLPLRRRGPQGGVPARAPARARGLRRARCTSTRTPTATRTPRACGTSPPAAWRPTARWPRRPRTSTRCPRSRRRSRRASTPELALRERRRRRGRDAEGRGLGARRAGRARLLQRAARPDPRRRAARRALRVDTAACQLFSWQAGRNRGPRRGERVATLARDGGGGHRCSGRRSTRDGAAGHHGSGAQRGNAVTGLAGAAAQREPARRALTSTGNSNWFTQPRRPCVNISATDNVAVTKLEYSLDNGANYIDIPITAGPSVTGTAASPQQGNTTVRYRATDAAGNIARGVAANTTLNQAAAAGATAVRLASTTGRAAGDELVIDTGDNAETVKIASIVTPAPAVAGAERQPDHAADEGARRDHRRPGLPAVPHDRRADRHPACRPRRCRPRSSTTASATA